MTTRRYFLKGASALTAAAAAEPVLSGSALAAGRASDEFIDQDATAMARLLKRGEISQAEAVEIVIRRIEAINPVLNALTTRTFDRARARAGSISLSTAFAGWPILIKDMIDVGGVRRTDGSRMMLANVPVENAPYVDGIEAAGMNIVAMTNVPEFAQLGLFTNNTAFGLTRNPWDLAKSPGGSSGGSGAAVAAGIVPIAHGTDGGGSNRFPACFCGLLGMKPSRGRMLPGEAGGTDGPFKTNQALSRTVRDSAALFHETQNRDGPFPPLRAITGPSTRRLKVALVTEIAGAIPAEPDVVSAQISAARLLEDLGHTVEPATYPVAADEFFAAYTNAFLRQFLFVADRARALSGRTAAQSGLIDPFTASITAFAASITDDAVAAGLAYLEALPQAFQHAFATHDVILSPVTPVASIGAEALRPSDRFTPRNRRFLEDRMAFAAPVNVVGNCAMSVPLYWSPLTGLPVGSMFQAAAGNDAMLYELAFELEAARPWRDRWAPYSAKFIPV